MQFKAVVFDLDGTLIDTIEDLKDSLNFVLEREAAPKEPTMRLNALWATDSKLMEGDFPRCRPRAYKECTAELISYYSSTPYKNSPL